MLATQGTLTICTPLPFADILGIKGKGKIIYLAQMQSQVATDSILNVESKYKVVSVLLGTVISSLVSKYSTREHLSAPPAHSAQSEPRQKGAAPVYVREISDVEISIEDVAKLSVTVCFCHILQTGLPSVF